MTRAVQQGSFGERPPSSRALFSAGHFNQSIAGPASPHPHIADMMTRRFWKPVIISLVVTPIALFLGVLSAGAGHGHYGMAKLLFPYTMLPAMVSGQISSFFILLAVAQFPAYGIVLGLANEKGRARLGAVVLSIAHTTAVVAVLLSVSENFS